MLIKAQADDIDLVKSCRKSTYIYDKAINQEGRLIQFEQRRERYALRANYYYFLIGKNFDLIQQTINEIQELDGKNTALTKTLRNIISESPQGITYTISKEIFHDFLNIFKDKMRNYFDGMSQDQTMFYQYVIIEHKRLLENVSYEARIIERDLTIQTLFHLEVLEMFYYQTWIYLKYCHGKDKLIYFEEIEQLFQFNQRQSRKLLTTYKFVVKYIKHNVYSTFSNLTTIFSLMKVRNQIFHVLNHGQRVAIIYDNKFMDHYKIYRITELQVESKCQQYQFCEVAFFSYQRQIWKQSFKVRCQISKNLIQTYQNNSEAIKRNRLFFRVKYSLNFDSLRNFQGLIERKQMDTIKKFAQITNWAKKCQLQHKFRYIFATGYSFKDAFDKFGINQKYDLRHFQRIPVGKLDAVVSFINVAFRQQDYISFYTGKLLKIEESLNRQFIIIKNTRISYSEIEKNIIRKGSDNKFDKQDLVANLILITNRKNIKSICIVRGRMKDRKYVSILKKIVLCLKQEQPFIIVLNSYYKRHSFQWQEYGTLFSYVWKKLKTKLYVTNVRQYSELNHFVLSYLKAKIMLQAASITRYNFYESVQRIVCNNIVKISARLNNKPMG